MAGHLTKEAIRPCGTCSEVGVWNFCAGCLTVSYCTSACQRKAWPAHKAACKAAKEDVEARAEAGDGSCCYIMGQRDIQAGATWSKWMVKGAKLGDTNCSISLYSTTLGDPTVTGPPMRLAAQSLEKYAVAGSHLAAYSVAMWHFRQLDRKAALKWM